MLSSSFLLPIRRFYKTCLVFSFILNLQGQILTASQIIDLDLNLFRVDKKNSAITHLLETEDKETITKVVVKLISSEDKLINPSHAFRLRCLEAGKNYKERRKLTGEACVCVDGYQVGIELLKRAPSELRQKNLLPALKSLYEKTQDSELKLNLHHALSLFESEYANTYTLSGIKKQERVKWKANHSWNGVLNPNHPRGEVLDYFQDYSTYLNDQTVHDLMNAIRRHENGYLRYLGMVLERHYQKESVLLLLELLKEDDWYPRWAATTVLEILGPKAKDSIAILQKHLNDNNEDIAVRIGAARAIARINGKNPFDDYKRLPDYKAAIIASTRDKVTRWREQYITREGEKFKTTGKHPNSGIKGRAVYAMWTNQHLKEVNDYLVEICEKGIADGVGWSPNHAIIELFTLFCTQSRFKPGRLSPEAEKVSKDFAFKFCNGELKTSKHHHVTGPEAQEKLRLRKDNPKLVLPSNDNGYLKPLTFNYLSCAALREFPEYRNRKFKTGETVEERYHILNQLLIESFTDWALNGLTPELGSGGYEIYTWDCIFQMANLSPSPKLRQVAKMYIDISLIEVEQISSNTVRAGYKSRPKSNWLGSRLRPIRALLFGERGGSTIYSSFALSEYQAPDAAILLRKLGSPIPEFEIKNQYLGELAENSPGFGGATHFWKKNPPCIGYAYHTPDYIVGGVQFDPNRGLFAGFASHWFGVAFNNLQSVSFGCYYGSQTCLQDKNAMIFQRFSGSLWPGRPLIALSRDLKWELQDGWLFVDNETAYAAVNVLAGGMVMDPAPTPLQRIWPNDPFSPVVVQTGRSKDYPSFKDFQKKVLDSKLELSYVDGSKQIIKKVVYQGLGSEELSFSADTKNIQCHKHFDGSEAWIGPSMIGRKPLDLDVSHTYLSPFLKQKINAENIQVQYNGQKWDYNFRDHVISN